ncbi:MAG TPA: SpoIID/LytB domain-containing protein [Actinomycetota bacterium]|nr:SpoIID/LytB domain-containing protein [Actinomycetota bacterium]
MAQFGAKGLADEGRSYTEILGHYYSGTRVESRDPVWGVRVMLVGNADRIELSGNARFEFHLDGVAIAASNGNDGTWVVRADAANRYLIYRPDGSLAAGPVGGPTQHVLIAFANWGTLLRSPQTGHRYRYGHMELNTHDDRRLRLISIMPMEAYLRGLGEMPSSWHAEALKAQAVAARTYAAEKVTRVGQARSGCNCGLYADTRDQAYVGYTKEDPASFGGSSATAARWPNAVEATANQVVTYPVSGSWRLAETYYSSSSGGRTERNEDVWGGTARPYLRDRDDPWSQLPANPYANWSVEMSQADVAAKLGMGRVDSIDLSARTAGGGVATARVYGDTNKTFTGDRFRSALGLRSTKIWIDSAPPPPVQPTWRGWSSLPPIATSRSADPVVVAAPNSALHAVVVDSSNVPMTSRRDPSTGAWSAWTRVGDAGSAGFEPTAALTKDSAVHAALRGTDGLIYVARRDASSGAWSGWSFVGTRQSFGSAPALAAAPDGSAWLVMVKPADNTIWIARREPSRPWSDWQRVGSGPDAGLEPAIAVGGDGAVHIVIRGTDGVPYATVRDPSTGSWAGWARLGPAGSFGYEPSLTVSSRGIEALVRGSDDGLYHAVRSGSGWSSWFRVGSSFEKAGPGKAPHLATGPDGRVHLTVAGSDDGIYHNVYTVGQVWSGWGRVGSSSDKVGPGGEVPIVGVPDGSVAAFVRGTDDRVYSNLRR